jgi:putative secretion ATPase (PEP-CTERM system associated)
MYERFYNLRERPFALSPDPDYLYLSRVHQEALGYLRYGIEGHAGFVVITGEIGSGKTTLLQTLLRSLDRNISVARIMNTMLDPRELLEAVMLDLGLEPAGLSKPAMIHELGRYLVEQRQAGRLVLLVIDEAQNLGLPTLEEVRMLSNLETEKSKLIQIVLVGQPNLRDTLGRAELEQMRQRITVSYHLQPLDAKETGAYINHRLAKASIGTPLEFPPDTTRLIHARSKGVPRMINVICDSVLLFGYGEEKAAIDLPLVELVVEELVATGVLPASPGRSPILVADPRPAPAREPIRTPVLTEPAPQPVAAGLAAVASPTVEEGRALAARREALAEQQRILAEEYRLLRELGRRAAPAAGRGPWPPPFGADPTRRTVASTFRAEPFGASAASGWWTRMRRRLSGEPA